MYSDSLGLDGPGIESRWGRDFPHLSRPALRPTQVFPGGKEAGAWRNHPPHLAPRLKKEQSYTSTPLWAFMACSRVKFTFTVLIIIIIIAIIVIIVVLEVLARGWRVRGFELRRWRDSPDRSKQTLRPNLPPVPYNEYRFSSAGIKCPKLGVDHPPLLAPRLKKEYSCTSTPSMSTWHVTGDPLWL